MSKLTEKNTGGRPVAFKTPEEMQKMIDKYFATCNKGEMVERIVDGEIIKEKQKIPYTITGLAMACGITRETLNNYGNKDGFSDTVGYAKLIVENYCEVNSILGKIPPSIGQFILKNHGWRDKTEQEISGGIKVTRIKKSFDGK